MLERAYDPTERLLEGVSVLIADNSADQLELMEFVFRRCGASVIAVASESAALSAIRSVRPDVVVSDIGLAEGDGHSLVREMRTWMAAEGGRTPAVAVTGWCRESDRLAAIDAGFQMYLAKPVHLTVLIDAVTDLASERSGERENVRGERHASPPSLHR
jgi:CheY-like chemotaxis protein